MQKIILLLDMDAFFAQIEERENPKIKGKPVVVGSDPKQGKGRGVVSTANYEARKYGIHSAMPISEAWRRCPQAVFLPPSMEYYQGVSEKIIGILKKYSPKWEVVSVDEAYLDISFAENYEEAEGIARKIKNEIFKKEKLTSTIGIGPNKLIAKIAASKGKPNGLKIIKPEMIQEFLDPLDIDDLPGIGPKTAEKFRAIGIAKIQELRKLPEEKLREKFGKIGSYIFQRSKGINEDEVISETAVKSVGRQYTFEKDTRDPETLMETFGELLSEVTREIEENNYYFKTITVVCRFQGFETHTKDKSLQKKTKDLKIFKSEAKKLLLKFLIENPKLIRLIGVRAKIEENQPLDR